MKASEIRALSDADLRSKLNDAKEELMNLRFQQATGELTDYTRLRHTRRTIAKFLTILSEREKQATVEGER
jgi:large subunit ribosomal protein L29